MKVLERTTTANEVEALSYISSYDTVSARATAAKTRREVRPESCMLYWEVE